MKNFTLVTGASGGIGRELSYVFARNGHNLVLVARSGEKLSELAEEISAKYHVETRIIVSDLSADRAADILYAETQNQGMFIENLVNNAGFGDYGFFPETDKHKNERMIALNIAALTNLTHLYLPEMVKAGKGKILNVASVAAFMPGSYMTLYYATKAFVLSFSEGLAAELKGTGISVTALCPGPTHTGFESTSANGGELGLFGKMPVASAQSVAEYGYRAMRRGKKVAIYGLINKTLIFIIRFSPRGWVRSVVRTLQKN